MVRCGSKNGHQKKIIWLKEIDLLAQNMLTVLGSIVDMFGSGVGDYITT